MLFRAWLVFLKVIFVRFHNVVNILEVMCSAGSWRRNGWHYPCPGIPARVFEAKMWLLVLEPWCEELWAVLCRRDEEHEAAMPGCARAERRAQASVQDMTFGLNPHRFAEGARRMEQSVREEFGI